MVVKNTPKSVNDLPVEINILDNNSIKSYCFGFLKGGQFENKGDGDLNKDKKVIGAVTEELKKSEMVGSFGSCH